MQRISTERLRARTGDRLWLTDGGLETELVFHDGRDLPCFAAFTLLDEASGRARLRRYFEGYLDTARGLGAGFVLDTVTWRASHGWGAELGLDPAQIARINADSVAFARDLRASRGAQAADILVNGVIGPAGDGYRADGTLGADAAQAYHEQQVAALAWAGADMLTATTMTSVEEAVGIALAARGAGLPVVISFTVETDGRLPTGQTLAQAIAETEARSDGAPAWYGINCAHPEHFRDALGGDWVARIGGLRANASRRSHEELDEATELDDGNPQELAQDYRGLLGLLPGLRVLGGCCGTDLRHVSAIGHACCAPRAAA